MNLPLISVILPVYNGERYLARAIESILRQSYRAWELIIINDGSSDMTSSIARSFDDTRVRVFEQNNQGLAASLNRGISLANGVYIARQDHDDFSYPLRFERQIEYMENNSGCGMVGTWAEIWSGDTRTGRTHCYPADDLSLRFLLVFNNPFVHSSVMMRADTLAKVGWYETAPERQPPEDYELWSRLARHYQLANIPEILHVYREVPGSISRSGTNPFHDKLIKFTAENSAWLTGRSPDDPAVVFFASMVQGELDKFPANYDFHSVSAIFHEVLNTLGIGARQADCELKKLVFDQFRGVRHNYLRCRFGRTAGDLLASLERKMPKFVGGSSWPWTCCDY